MDLVELVPPGRVTSYKKLARACGYPLHSRTVGKIMADTEFLRPGVPAHRVVASSGALSGRLSFGPGNEMEALLAAEGVKIVHNRVCHPREVMWDPIEELKPLE